MYLEANITMGVDSMQLITSNFMPVNMQNKSFSSIFENLFSSSDSVEIAVGYISAEAIAEIEAMLRLNQVQWLGFDLVIGMHNFDGFTRQQYETAIKLNSYLKEARLGSVKVCTTFPYHGKVYIFSKDREVFAGTIGSSNLSGILDTHRIYETDILVTEKKALDQMITLVNTLLMKASKPIDEIPQPEFINTSNPVLRDVDHVSEATDAERMKVLSSLTEPSFDIPIKSTPRSNLNAYFGKGRENTKTGFIRPRHWYEAELIVGKAITQQDGYPEKGHHFTVITDDGWKFLCNVNGDYSKNFRSSNNLQILGRWLKGRLEDHGCLKIGEQVSEAVLECYGRSYFTLRATKDSEVWYLDFSKK